MRTIAFLIFALTTSLPAMCQESSTYLRLKSGLKYREGYIIDSDSIKIKGLVRDLLMNESKAYSMVTFVHQNGTKRKYYPRNIKGYGYSMYKYESDGRLFYEIVVSGKKANLYKRIYQSSTMMPGGAGMPAMTTTSSSENFYVRKINETEFKQVMKKKFKEEFAAYFEDCADLASDISEEKVTHKDIRSLVRKYNFCQ